MRQIYLASLAVPALALAACAPDAPSPRAVAGPAVAASPQGTMLPGQRTIITDVGERSVRRVLVGPNGGSVWLVYDEAPGRPQSARVVRLENVNGSLQVVYDTATPTTPVGGSGVPRLVQQGGGNYSVVYGPPARPARR